jgi:hypothetical protein
MNDVEKLTQAVRELAFEYPNATYRSTDPRGACHYYRGVVENGPPEEGCIMGHAARRADLSELVERMQTPEPIHHIMANCGGWLRCVQLGQDKGRTWGEAVRYADEHS